MTKWKELVEEAAKNLGGEANLEKLYEEVKKVVEAKDPEKLKTNRNIEAKVRQVVQKSGSFYQKEKGSGVWTLKKEVLEVV